MEPKPQPVNSPVDWQEVLATSVTTVESLADLVALPEISPQQGESARQYPVFVTRPYVGRIRTGCPTDPLLAQVLPQKEEMLAVEGFKRDPIGECAATGPSGLIRKFRGRALIIANRQCSVHCRFCFRRHQIHSIGLEYTPLWKVWAEAIGQDASISEVILSGGDPLLLEDGELQEGLGVLGRIPHVRRFRIHTRLPITLPQRITENLLNTLAVSSRPVLVVVHINHRREIDASVEAAFRRLRNAGFPLLAQTVLLRGVNDSVEALADMYETLADLGVIPYYLHQLDRVAGAAHFEVPEKEGIEIVQRLRAILPGYVVPRYVRERIGAEWKEEVE